MIASVPAGIAHDLADEGPGWPALLPTRPSTPRPLAARSLLILRWLVAQGAARSSRVRRRFTRLSVPAHLSYLRGLGLVTRPDPDGHYSPTRRGHLVAERGHL